MSNSAGRTDFGLVMPGTGLVTTNDCTVLFGSSNDTSMLHLTQRDGGGVAMVAAPVSGVVAHWPTNGSLDSIETLPLPIVAPVPPNAPAFGTGDARYGQTLELDGNDHATVARHVAMETASFTIDAWVRLDVRPAAAGYAAIVEKSISDTNRQYSIRAYGETAASTRLSLDVSASGVGYASIKGTTDIGDGNWHHVAAVIDGTATRATIYVDGVPENALAFVGTVDPSAEPIYIGYSEDNANYWWDGGIDELRLHNVARTSAEIRSYATGAVSDYADAALPGDTDWGTGGNMFGVCLRSVAGVGSSATWPVHATCAATDGSHWRPVVGTIGAASKVAASTTAGTDVTANLRFGFRTAMSQAPGTYRAPITFTVVAPNA